MSSDTRAILGSDAEKCDSRSLFMDRFAQPDAKDDATSTPRRNWFNHLIGKTPCIQINKTWLPESSAVQPLYAQLQSRLMVNMAGGVMVNAGLCLDRFGLPYLPGSAVNGSARRLALAALHEWMETGAKPSGDDNLFTPACNSFSTPADMLAEIALVFGWGEEDWDVCGRSKEGRFKSDLVYAVGESRWPMIFQQAGHLLLRKGPTAARDFGHFAGSVSFLPAYPIRVGSQNLPLPEPELGKLELDVVTCHHSDYYGRKEVKRGELVMPIALDSEQRILPIVFPAIAPGHVFTFAVLRLHNCPPSRQDRARAWLANSLTTFGLGAKTAAGYGWFDVSETLQSSVRSALKAAGDRRLKEQFDREEESRRKSKERQDQELRETMKAAMANLTPDQQEDFKLAQLTVDQFRSALDNYAKRATEEQKAIVRAMRSERDVPGSRRAFWDDLKAKAHKKGGKYAQTEQAIRQLGKQMFPGKDGKMP
jgi:CRISPR/Cas system CMR subunit Cmr6 (Cas7 group RAMP superfamily)